MSPLFLLILSIPGTILFTLSSQTSTEICKNYPYLVFYLVSPYHILHLLLNNDLIWLFPLQLFSLFTSGTYFQVSNFIYFSSISEMTFAFYVYTRSSLEVGPVTMYIFLGRRWKLKCLHLMRLVLWTKTLAVTYALFCSHLLISAFIILNSLWFC